MGNIKIEKVLDGMEVHLARIDFDAKKELQDKRTALQKQLDELDISAREQLQSACDEATAQIAGFSDNIDFLDSMIVNLENIINETADIMAEKKGFSERFDEKNKKMLNRCRNVVGNLVWLQYFFKREIGCVAQKRKSAKQELQQLEEIVKERRRLKRELNLTTLRIKRIEKQEARQYRRGGRR